MREEEEALRRAVSMPYKEQCTLNLTVWFKNRIMGNPMKKAPYILSWNRWEVSMTCSDRDFFPLYVIGMELYRSCLPHDLTMYLDLVEERLVSCWICPACQGNFAASSASQGTHQEYTAFSTSLSALH
jgi:hypothetical protein